jgi:hypothetical protein
MNVNSISEFLFNRQPKPGELDARAFSLTKILSSAAIIVGPVATVLVHTIGRVHFSPGQIVALAIGLLGFLAITASADVLGRSYAAGAQSRSDAAANELKASQAAAGQFVQFPHPVPGRMIAAGEDPHVEIYGSAFGDQGYFLVREESGVFSWKPASMVTFGDGKAVAV